ncbi:MAG TPA: maleylpyruvate isomerase family mycothiol-dependent enzyme [Acidimicrobiia bacterium]
MDQIMAAVAEQHAELAGLLDGLDADGWRLPAPACPGWTIADVVLHLAQTDELATSSARREFGSGFSELFRGESSASNVDEAAEVMVVAERDTTSADLFERWTASAAEMRAVLGACDPSARLQWVTGELSARTLATTRLSEAWIHTGDVAGALGVELAPTDRLWHIARLAWRTVPYAFTRAGRTPPGAVAFVLRGPSGDEWDFEPDGPPGTTIRGDAVDLCLVAAQRAEPPATSLRGDGPNVDEVLELVRTYA